MIQTGYVRVTTDHPEVSIQVLCRSRTGWSLFQPRGNVSVWQFDDADPALDTLICVINRKDAEDSEIEIETLWHDNRDPTTPIRRSFDCYYTETKLISARDCILGTPST